MVFGANTYLLGENTEVLGENTLVFVANTLALGAKHWYLWQIGGNTGKYEGNCGK